MGEHLIHCGASRQPLQRLRNGADELHDMLAGRVITSLMLLCLISGSAWLWL